ncbi:MAG: UpxY family transcription antiterminator [Rikenellaceae bacterium]
MEYIIVNNITGRAWYAMKASYGRALKAKDILDSMAIENYVPMGYKKERVGGRNRITPVAVIPNLIFINADVSQLKEVRVRINFIHHMLIKSEGKENVLEPIVVPDIEMSRFMKVIVDAQESVKFVDLTINSQIISKGTKVRVIDGEYIGYEGVLCRPKGSRAKKVLIDVCGLAPVELPVIDIELLEEI